MKILMVNKFLYPKGGSETYVIKFGKFLEEKGNDVQYFGLNNEKNILKNRENLYVKDIDLQKTSLKNALRVNRLIYSNEAKRKMIKLLKTFKPDLIILNNIEYHLTPSIIVAIKKYKKKINTKAKTFYVTHDYQLICPSHGLYDGETKICEKCINGNFKNCYKGKCIKSSRLKSLLGTIDSYYWRRKNIYKYIDKFICPSNFLKNKLDTQGEFKNKTIAIHNFVDNIEKKEYKKEDYVLYFGKLSKDKGVETLLKVAKELQNIKFIFAGYGPLEKKIKEVSNAKFVGYKEGKELEELIGKARFSVCPSEWYENCPFSVIESQMLGTPVIGADIGGIPELIEKGITGEIFESRNAEELKDKIKKLWDDKEKMNTYSKNCFKAKFDTIETYYEKIMKIYNEN